MDSLGVFAAEVGEVVDGVTDNVHQTAFDLVAGRDRDGLAEVDHRHTAAQAVGAFHSDTADGVFADVLLHFEDEFGAVFAGDFEGGVDWGQSVALAFKGHVDHRADYLCNFANIFAHCFSAYKEG